MNNHKEKQGLNELAAEIHKNAVAHGWWETEPSLPEILMLCVSELSEALEDFRDGKEPDRIYELCASGGISNNAEPCEYNISENEECECLKPEGIPVELADCIIRILDYCGHAKIDIEEAIRLKCEYNKSRPYRHGGKRI